MWMTGPFLLQYSVGGRDRAGRNLDSVCLLPFTEALTSWLGFSAQADVTRTLESVSLKRNPQRNFSLHRKSGGHRRALRTK